ncbi:MAG: hypothetical protein EAZ94_04355 [Oscillatoriales cyanobacterium]|nr:MAG: hypothetical protein EAZ94_04355 [Oscillatoriales cyanobacterium]TAE64733.1 MAG: hypothetical protein EAZ86_26285 [Oscillatoriales cyanobacterium]
MKIISEISLSPQEFRKLTGWSVYKISRETGIPLQTLYCYLREPGAPGYREPKPQITLLFGLLHKVLCTA